MQDYALSKTEEVMKRRKRRKIWQKVVLSLACVAVFITSYMMILPAITMGQTAYCGVEEHQHSDTCFEIQLVCGYDEPQEHGAEASESSHIHSDECYEEQESLICGQTESDEHIHGESCIRREQTLVCDIPESVEASSDVQETHIHTEDCYETVLVCQKEEHQHTLICYSNPEADLESASVWEQNVSDVKLTGVWADDVVAVAESQLGYRESIKNYVVAEDGETTRGITRYGQWYGDPYADWCAMFVSFCLHYASVPEYAIPYDEECPHWIENLSDSEWDLYREAGTYTPAKGDIVFFDNDDDGCADHVGLVRNQNEEILTVIEGNCSDCVKLNEYQVNDGCIMGYGALPENNAPQVMNEASAAQDQTLIAAIYTDAAYQERMEDTTTITVSGNIPEAAEALAFPVSVETELTVLCAYDITIWLPDGSLFEPAEGESLSVEIQSPVLECLEEGIHAEVYHVPEEGEPELIESQNTDGGVCFEADHFSVYAVTAAAQAINSSERIPAKSSDGDYWQPSSYPYYQSSNYGAYYNNGVNNWEYIDAFLLVPRADTAYDWTPNMTEWTASADANYIVAYCAELTVGINHNFNTPYQSYVMTDAPLTEAQKESLSAIIQHAYPFISKEQAITDMRNAGYSLTNCTENELLTATQLAIWDITEGTSHVYKDGKICNISSYGDNHVRDISSITLNPLTTFSNIASNAQSNADKIRAYLKSRSTDSRTEVNLVGLEITETRQSEDAYLAVVQITLSRALAADESGVVTITTDTGASVTADIPEDVTTFSVTLEGLTGMESKISAIGTVRQSDCFEIYYFDSATYQDMVGGQLVDKEHTSSIELTIDHGAASISVEKRWADGTAGADSVTVQLLANGTSYSEPVTLNAGNDWFYKWSGLPERDLGGTAINYTVSEISVEGYTTTISLASSSDADIYWSQVTGLESGVTYLLVADGYGAMTNTDGSIGWTDVSDILETGATAAEAALWTYDGKLQNSGQYLKVKDIWSGTIILSSSGDSVSFGDGRLRVSSRYFGLKDGTPTGFLSSGDSRLLSFTVYQRTSKSNLWGDTHYIITNEKTSDVLPVAFAKYSVIGDGSDPMLIAGAELALYRADETGETIPGTQTAGVLVEEWTSDSEAVGGLHTMVLSSGVYYLVEITPPEGHNGLAGPIVFTVDAEQGQLEIIDYPEHEDLTGSVVGEALVPVYNTAFYILPATGGGGTFPYTMGGCLLIAAALLLLFIMKKRGEMTSS